MFEAGKRDPTGKVLDRLAERLQVTPDQLLSGVRQEDSVQARVDLALAKVALHEGRAAESAALLEPLVTGPGAAWLGEQDRFDAALALAACYERTGRLREAVTLLEARREQAEAAPSDLPWLPVVVSLARCYRDAGDASRAVDLAEAALRRCAELGLEGLDGHVQLVSTLAGVYGDRGDLLRAAQLLDALLLTTKQEDNETRGYAYWNAAMNAAERGERGEALRLIERAAALVAEGDDERNAARVRVARAWIMLNQDNADAEGARDLLRAALPALRKHSGNESLAKAEVELARAEIVLGRPVVARRLAAKALSRLSDEQPLSAAAAHAAIGAARMAEGDPDAGAQQLHRAAELLGTTDASRQAATLWRQLAGAYVSLGHHDRAVRALERALDCAGVTAERLPVPTAPGARRHGNGALRPGSAIHG